MSTPKKTTPKPTVEAALRKKLSEYAAALEEQHLITEQQAERLREMSALSEERERRIVAFNEAFTAIRKTCVAGGVTDAESMATQHAVKRLAARVADYQRMKRDLTYSVSHRRRLQEALEKEGYHVSYSHNGGITTIGHKMTWQDYSVCALLTVGVFFGTGLFVYGLFLAGR